MFGAIMAITSSFAAAEQIIPLVGFPQYGLRRTHNRGTLDRLW